MTFCLAKSQRILTTFFAIQNQASHLTFVPMSPEGRAAGAPTRRSLVQGTTIQRPGIPMECAPESGLVDEHIQSDWRMIAGSDKVLWLQHPVVFPGECDRRATIVHRLATATMRRSHSSRLPRKPRSQAVLKLSRAVISRRFPFLYR
jgi:hypothetical protein